MQAAKDEPHHVFDWTVPARLDGKPLTIAGTLEYEPPPNTFPKPLIAVPVLLVVLGGVVVWLRNRRGRRADATYDLIGREPAEPGRAAAGFSRRADP